MRGEELPPGRSLRAFGRWLETVFPEDIGDCAPSHVVIQIRQGSADPRVAPVPILRHQLHDQLPDLVLDARASGPAPAAAVVFLIDESSMPAE